MQLKIRRKALQLQVGQLDVTLEDQQHQARKAGEERELARVALEQAQKDKEMMLEKYSKVQQKFPEKIKPLSTDGTTPETAKQMKNRRLTFPIPVHSPAPSPPLVLRGLFQLKKDTNIDKIAGPNRVSASTRQVLLKVPEVKSPQVQGKQVGEANSGGRRPTVMRKNNLPESDSTRVTMLTELQKGGVSLRKVEKERKETTEDGEGETSRQSRGPSVVMSRLAHSMSIRRDVMEQSDDEGTNEWD